MNNNILSATQKKAILDIIFYYESFDEFVFLDYAGDIVKQAAKVILSRPIPKKKGKLITYAWLESEKQFQAQDVFVFEVQNNEIINLKKL